MVRESRPPAREPASSWLSRRSTIATSTPADASSPASISPVGPPPAITTACVVTTAPSARRCTASQRTDGVCALPPALPQGARGLYCGYGIEPCFPPRRESLLAWRLPHLD